MESPNERTTRVDDRLWVLVRGEGVDFSPGRGAQIEFCRRVRNRCQANEPITIAGRGKEKGGVQLGFCGAVRAPCVWRPRTSSKKMARKFNDQRRADEEHTTTAAGSRDQMRAQLIIGYHHRVGCLIGRRLIRPLCSRSSRSRRRSTRPNFQPTNSCQRSDPPTKSTVWPSSHRCSSFSLSLEPNR